MRDRVADSRGRGEGEIDDAERYGQSLRRLLCDQLTHTGDLERGFLHEIGNLGDILTICLFECGSYYAGTRNADIDDAVRFTDAVKCARHEGVILHGVTEGDELRRADAVVIGGELGGIDNRLTHHLYRVHIDTGLGRADVDGGAYSLGDGERLRDTLDQRVITRGKAFLHQCGIPADEVDAEGICSSVKRLGEF